MGSYEIDINKESGKIFLHYTGDGWCCVEITKQQLKEFKSGTLDLLSLNWW